MLIIVRIVLYYNQYPIFEQKTASSADLANKAVAFKIIDELVRFLQPYTYSLLRLLIPLDHGHVVFEY